MNTFLYFLVDKSIAKDINPILQDALFLTAVLNSCINPLVYGSFYIKRLRQGKLQRQQTAPSHHSDVQAASDKDQKNAKPFKTKVVCEDSEPATKVIDPKQITKM